MTQAPDTATPRIRLVALPERDPNRTDFECGCAWYYATAESEGQSAMWICPDHRTCPDPTLHRVAEAPLRPLSDLLQAAVLLAEVADEVVAASSEARIRIDALLAAVKVLS